jgi:pimeloyl-ACP methyl ester carboxylesterase
MKLSRQTIRWILKRILFWFVMAPVILLVFICSCADRLIFHPPYPSYTRSDDLLIIPVTPTENIAAMYRPADPNGFVLLFSHGNAEDIGRNVDFFELANEHGFGIFAYDYRGYGQSDGKAGEKNTYQDITAAYRYLTETLQIPPQRILILGRSVGSGPSTWLATRQPAAGLVLESPFVSAFRVVTKYKILPFDRYDNLGRIKNIKCPLLIIQGKEDEVVGFWHGPMLYEAANNPKMNYWVESAGHNDLLWVAGEQYWKTLERFKETLTANEKIAR